MPVFSVTKSRSVSMTTTPDSDPPGTEHPDLGPIGELSLGRGHYIGTDAATSKQEYGQHLTAQRPELGKVQTCGWRIGHQARV
jgi:hypothetical protein